jgi:methylated-DNA-[protein]-cysteine S-methyltransferase
MNRLIYFDYLASPLGDLLIVGDSQHVTRLYLPNHKGAAPPDADWRQSPAPFEQARQQLAEYFAGARQNFDIPVLPAGTAFQQRVWQQLLRIPFGTTISYAELARRIGMPNASRAVGNANGRNPISIIIPCHRVIGANGRLTGYAGGLDNKRWLLDRERGEQVLSQTPRRRVLFPH